MGTVRAGGGGGRKRKSWFGWRSGARLLGTRGRGGHRPRCDLLFQPSTRPGRAPRQCREKPRPARRGPGKQRLAVMPTGVSRPRAWRQFSRTLAPSCARPRARPVPPGQKDADLSGLPGTCLAVGRHRLSQKGALARRPLGSRARPGLASERRGAVLQARQWRPGRGQGRLRPPSPPGSAQARSRFPGDWRKALRRPRPGGRAGIPLERELRALLGSVPKAWEEGNGRGSIVRKFPVFKN